MRVMVPLADGFEDIEAMTIVNVLRKAGISVETVGVVGSIISPSSALEFSFKLVEKLKGQEMARNIKTSV